LICHQCDKTIKGFEKIITPDGKAYHMECWRPKVPDEDLIS